MLAELLRQIPSDAESDSEDVEARFFPSPTRDPEADDMREDWKAHVEPELHAFFLDARQVVEADLRGMKEEVNAFALEFPGGHAEAWMNALNQARLALAVLHHFGEREMSAPPPMEIHEERDLALLKIFFYAEIQHWLVEMEDV
jgi:hypothetical protein